MKQTLHILLGLILCIAASSFVDYHTFDVLDIIGLLLVAIGSGIIFSTVVKMEKKLGEYYEGKSI